MARKSKTTTPKPEPKAKKAKQQHGCVCGCGKPTGSLFAQGHDAQIKGMLLRVAAGRPVEGERSAVGALLQRATKDARVREALNSAAFVPLCRAAVTALRAPKVA